ncbi:hypothetical protein DNHGIG_04540 [Collibacillus ludicampi]|jgi:hypothetical protein|uniref:Uncharacterized protein n=1 Tax=Collibacillus ludicampi TaxID=2771369 RepID=A0AAV4LAV5_9BACL|nr:hypothetical protein [Collibacillus ludicampi]GIM44905.1 hypothetical protein DNHGIG_04540 [Collibacillus ludicampi]
MNIEKAVDDFCQYIWDEYEKNPEILPAEVTINHVGTGVIAKIDQDGLYFEANGQEFDMDEWFMQNNFTSDTLGINPLH